MASPNPPAAAMTSSPSQTQAPVEKPSPPPVNILPSQTAQIYSFAHPALLVGVYAFRFQALVADPVQELLSDLPWLALLQVTYVLLCLPPAGTVPIAENSTGDGKASSRSSSGPGASVRPGKAGHRKKHSGKNDWAVVWSKLMPTFLSIALTFFLATPILAVLLVLFGAPLTTHNIETLLCAAHMAVLSATPLIYVHGVDGAVWREVWGIARPADAIWGSALGTGLGAWFGAIPIPLDWDRPWQAFPITILTGAYIGYALGSWISRTPFVYGKRIQFVPEPDEQEEKKTN